jgi:hypothetical protein
MKEILTWLVVFLVTVVSAKAQKEPPENGSIPSTLVISYYSPPVSRAGLRDYMLHVGLHQFEKWKTDGLLTTYRVLFACYLDTDTPAMTTMLDFSSPAAAIRWMKIENSMPGGLSHEGLSLVTSSQTAQVDRILHAAASSPAPHEESVFMVIPYEFFVPALEYRKYMEAYGVPQFEGWLQENVLASYDVYQNRYSASKPWGSLIVFEYRDAEALGKREAVMARVRAHLQNDPTWKAISESKHKIREEREAFIAQELSLR